MGRVKYAARNIAMGYVSSLVTALLNFILRTIFVYKLGDALTGVSSLYTDLLSMLSLAELGVGTAMNFSLYKPVAEGNIPKIKAYMKLYRKAYTVIALVIAVVGLVMVPFLPYLIKNPGSLEAKELTTYYLIFLFNTVSTYFVAYKYSLVNAEQKNYIQTNINLITKAVTIVLQIVVLLLFEDFLIYLLTAAAVELLQKIFASIYLDHRYPFLKEKQTEKLSGEESGELIKKTKALMLHKLGDTARLQTDSLIISGLIGISINGIVSNYTLVISTVSNFVNVIFNSVISSFGNLVATESVEKQYKTFRVYRFFAVWVYGFFAIGFYALLTPLIHLWMGEARTLAEIVVACILIDYFFKGERIVLSNFKTAAGVFEQDKYLALIQGLVNLVISVVMVWKVGLVGVYIGTIVSGLIANVTKPIIIYHTCFERSSLDYFKDSVKYLAVMAGQLLLAFPVHKLVMESVSIPAFLVGGVVITIVFNVLFYLVFRKSDECRYLVGILVGKLAKKREGQ